MVTTESRSKNNSIFTVIILLLLLGLSLWLTIEKVINTKLVDDLKVEKLSAETLLSEKLSLQKELIKIKSALNTANGENINMNVLLKESLHKTDKAERNLANSLKVNNTMGLLEKEIIECQKFKDSLVRELVILNTSLNQHKNSTKEMEKIIALMRYENQQLQEEINTRRPTSLNDALIESNKRNGKLTVKGNRTRKFVITTDVPYDLKNLTVKVTDPLGREIPVNDSDLSVRVVKEHTSEAFPTQNIGEISFKRLEMVITPHVKLTNGIYKILIMNDRVSIGSLQVKFR